MDHSKLFNQISQANNNQMFDMENISDDDDADTNIRETVISSNSTIGKFHDTRTIKKGKLRDGNSQLMQSSTKEMYPSQMRNVSR